MKIFKRNGCDGIYRSYDVHFTKFCDNNCSFCIDKQCWSPNEGKPDYKAMAKSIIENQDGFDDVMILGGEPCLFLDELLEFVKLIKEYTLLKVYCTSSLPKTCYDNKNKFFDILNLVDGFNISVQHYKEEVADAIRGCVSQYDRQSFYKELPFKYKIRLNLNLVRGYLDSRASIIRCLLHYDRFGFGSIKLSELQNCSDSYVSFEKVFNCKLQSPFSFGCQTKPDLYAITGYHFLPPVILKRSCFLCEDSLKANLIDTAKMVTKVFIDDRISPQPKFGVVYEDGTIKNGWVSGKEVL